MKGSEIMKTREQACIIWSEICKNCKRHEVSLPGGVYNTIFENTLPYVQLCDKMYDKFSIATQSGDIAAIHELYNTANLSDYQKQKIENMRQINNELLSTLNPYILQEKYNFLEPYINELALDPVVQDRLLSLDDYELYIIKKIVDLSSSYGIYSHELIGNILNRVGRSSNSFINNELLLEKVTSFFELIKRCEDQYALNDEIIGNIGFIIKTGIFPSNIEELQDFTSEIKKMLSEDIITNDNVESLKDNLLYVLFGMDLSEAKFFIEKFDTEGLTLNEGMIELESIKMILDCEDIDKLKKVATTLINDKEFKINLFNNSLVEEKLLRTYAKEFNKCKPKFEASNLLANIDGINIYDSGNEFYALVKTLGAFSGEGKDEINYYEEWNSDRYSSHINAVSLIRNDNLAFVEMDGKPHIKLGFFGFDETMFLGGAPEDINSNLYSSKMSAKVDFKLSSPSKFIDNTRKWHNELDYERKDNNSQKSSFKKNPDFIILDQECEDLSQLSIEEQNQFEEYKNNTIKAAKEFGNIPILVINRERIAINENNLIRKMLDDYSISHDIKLLKNIIIKFNNNRNGSRGLHHTYIREKYFSNQYFQDILDEIANMIPDDQIDFFRELILEEYDKMAYCPYDQTTIDIFDQPDNLSKRGGLSV